MKILLLALLLINPIITTSNVQLNGKTWNSPLLDCGNGRKGTKCFNHKTVSLSWDHPTQRTDGAALALKEIAYYTIRVRKNSGGTWRAIKVPPLTTFTLTKQTPGFYEFTIATKDKSDDPEGPQSAVVSLTIT